MQITQNIHMMFLFGFVSGLLNGLFASGAGQILVCGLIFLFKVDTYKARATSLACMCIASVITFVSYIPYVKITLTQVITIIVSSVIFGTLGSKIMSKINANILNLISGCIVTLLAIYSLSVG